MASNIPQVGQNISYIKSSILGTFWKNADRNGNNKLIGFVCKVGAGEYVILSVENYSNKVTDISGKFTAKNFKKFDAMCGEARYTAA